MLIMQRGNRLIALVAVCLVAGCSEPVNEVQLAADQAPSSPASLDPEQPDSTTPQVETQQEEATPDQESTGQPTQQEPAETSRLDQALQNLDSKPVEDPHAPQPVEPAEVHEALQPLVEESWKRLHPGYEVWFDMKNKQVIVGGRICFRDGPLEMFACPMYTKEHESVVATVSNAEIVHAGLLAVGAMTGHPVQWEPEYKAATGTLIKIDVRWKEGGETRDMPAQEMIIDSLTEKPSTYDWVFAGSKVWHDPGDPEYREYFADGGDMICVSNFTTAMLDLPVESSATNAGLRFFANPEKIPALGTPVLLVLKPDLSTNPQPAEEKNQTAEAGEGQDAGADK